MQVYHFKISLFGYHEQPVNQLHRVIAVSENSTFADLHDAIFEAFDREDPHLYSFFLTKKDTQSMRDIMKAPSITNPYSFAEGDVYPDIKPKNAATTTIKSAKLKLKEVLHYWFDFGDDWWHRLRLDRISTDNSTIQPYVKVTKKVGKSPAQYPDYDDEGDDVLFDERVLDISDLNIGDLNMNDGDFIAVDFDPQRLSELGIDEADMLFIVQALQKETLKAMTEVVDRYGVDKVVDMVKITGFVDVEPIESMLKNLPIFDFLESTDTPGLTLAQERDLLDTLIQKLQDRLANTEAKLAVAASATKTSTSKKPAANQKDK